MIAVTGASGGLGGRVARALAVPGSESADRVVAAGDLADVLREHPESLAHLRR